MSDDPLNASPSCRHQLRWAEVARICAAVAETMMVVACVKSHANRTPAVWQVALASDLVP